MREDVVLRIDDLARHGFSGPGSVWQPTVMRPPVTVAERSPPTVALTRVAVSVGAAGEPDSKLIDGRLSDVVLAGWPDTLVSGPSRRPSPRWRTSNQCGVPVLDRCCE